MVGKRRSNIAIAMEIINTCINGASKTKIVYQANLNFSTVCPYLDNLISKGLIEEFIKDSRVIYKITPKGLEWKKKFDQSIPLLEEIQASA